MGQSLTYKILANHLVDGSLGPGNQIAIKIDQVLTQDATGTTCYLLFEAMGVDRIKTDLAVSYVDHNMAQFGPENHDDHLYLQSIARKAGAYHSRPGNGICHQVHLERFGRCGATLLGCDSHTPTGGGLGMLAIGAGGLDVAVAMGGGPFYLACPKVIGVNLTGKLRPWVAAKDIILKLLSILSTRGNVGSMVEYFGDGLRCLSVPGRATCTNMGAELGLTTSVFPSDQITRQFLAAQGREKDWQGLSADPDAKYDHIIEINLDQLEPLCAAPSSPDNVVPVAQLGGRAVDQVVIGSCTNSSYQDLMVCAAVVEGRTVAENVEFAIAPGSRQVFEMIGLAGGLSRFIAAGARFLESACGPCIGLGYSPGHGKVSLRSFNRNFPGRSGTKDDLVYLASPETCVAAAITGKFTDPRELSDKLGIEYPKIDWPQKFVINDQMIQGPLSPGDARKAVVMRGPSIVQPPKGQKLEGDLEGKVLIKLGDKISTDTIMPAGAALKYRSNVPEYAKWVFDSLNEPGKPTFAQRALELKDQGGHGLIVARSSYGQGSSREHAALCPMYLGVRAVLACSIERICFANLVNFGIVPLLLADEQDYDDIEADDELGIKGLANAVRDGDSTVEVLNARTGKKIVCKLELSDRQRKILLAGGLLNYTRADAGK